MCRIADKTAAGLLDGPGAQGQARGELGEGPGCSFPAPLARYSQETEPEEVSACCRVSLFVCRGYILSLEEKVECM